MSTDGPATAEQRSAPTELLTGALGDRCASCQAPLAPDQRYCVECGERRGKHRFASPGPHAAPASPSTGRSRQRRPRGSSGATLIAGVATLLIAMGVGVLIGHNSGPSQPAASARYQVITVGGGGAGNAASTGAAGSTSPANSSGAKAKAKVKVATVHVTAKAVKAATKAANKVLGSSSNLSSNPTQQQGAKCSGGAGCQNGTFTGNFFGQ